VEEVVQLLLGQVVVELVRLLLDRVAAVLGLLLLGQVVVVPVRLLLEPVVVVLGLLL
jgi:hypothetical protein